MNNDIFQKNVKRWALLYPEAAECLSKIECQRVFFSEDKRNLLQKIDGNVEFFHSPEDPLGEAKQWFASIETRKINFLYVYGLGLGYYYDAALEWLKDPNHHLIFFEDDMEVIHRLFETEQGTRILGSSQVRIVHCNKSDLEFCRSIALRYWRGPMTVSALKYYQKRFPGFVSDITNFLFFWHNYFRGIFSECLDLGQHYYLNFYSNLFNLPHAFLAKSLYGQFAKLPAIICGAGPSLDKNLAVLETLGDRALIFAGGTSLNAVNSRGFVPHFGLGIDPYPEQLTRLIMNTAYEIPMLYRGRFNRDALNIIQGPTLFVNGAGGFKATNWFERQLGISEDKYEIDEGFNVVNFSLSLAQAMGCNPIIFVGLDLAYSDMKPYQSGVMHHPTHDRRKLFRTKKIQDELITRNDIYGRPVNTLWKWVTEAFWLGEFAREHSNTLFINATEGGIGIPGVINERLETIASLMLPHRSALRIRVHGEMQNGGMPKDVTHDRIVELLQQYIDSMKRCQRCCQRLFVEYRRMYNAFLEGKEEPEDLETESVKESLEELSKEIANECFVKEFKETFFNTIQLETDRIKADQTLTPAVRNAKKAQSQQNLQDFLHLAIKKNIEWAQNAILKAEKWQEKSDSQEAKLIQTEGEKYFFDEREFIITDPESSISFKESFSDSHPSVIRQYYDDSKMKFEQYYLKTVPHGPATFLSEEGKILGKCWYVNGLQQGKTVLYYNSGALYSVQRFKDGQMHGPQSFYFRDGTLKTILTYDKGKLNGDVKLYYSTGQKKRFLNFVDGKHHGLEQMWNRNGNLIVEANYNHDLPIGAARSWHSNGKLAREIVYDENSKILSIQQWNDQGILHKEEEDFFDEVSKHSQSLTGSLELVCEQLHAIAPLVSSKDNYLQEDFEKLKDSLNLLHQLSDKMMAETGMQKDFIKEPIWKSPNVQREIEKQLEEITKKLSNDIDIIQQITQKFKPPQSPSAEKKDDTDASK